MHGLIGVVRYLDEMHVSLRCSSASCAWPYLVVDSTSKGAGVEDGVLSEGKYWDKHTGGICERGAGFGTGGRRAAVSGGGKDRMVWLTRETAGRS